MIFIVLIIVIVTAVTLYLHQIYSHFHRRGVKCEKIVPLLGNTFSYFLGKYHVVDILTKAYYKFPKEKFIGRFEFTKPTIILRDLDLIKKITIGDYEHFLDHRVFLDENVNPLFGRNLFCLKGQEWKDMRSTLSPALTSSKIRVMVPFMVEVGDQIVSNLMKQIKENEISYIDVDVKDMMSRYASDVIASCAFGLKVDSYSDRNNKFYHHGIKASTFKFKQLLIYFISATFPWLMKMIKLPLFPVKSMNFFRTLVQDTMEYRKQNNVFRPDLIHLLMETKKVKEHYQQTHDDKADVDSGLTSKEDVKIVWSDDDLIAQAVLFFIAGFDSVSSAIVFLLYELAVNPDIQEKLYQEITENDAKNNGKFDYDTICGMTYMDMVVSEVLRLWPPCIALDRLCIKDYNLGKPNENATKDFIVRKGMGIQIPMWSIHRDPQYFPNPTKFNPERFSKENKKNIHRYAYMTFGLGPRNCIGYRFALCEIKVIVYQLLRHIEVSPGPKTMIPVELESKTYHLRIKGGHWLRLTLRS